MSDSGANARRKYISPSSIFSSRYQVASSYAFYILVAAGIFCITHKTFRTIAATVLLVGLAATLIQHSLQTDREPWREAVADIEARAEPGEPVVFYARYCRIPYEHYAVREDMPRLGVPFKGAPHNVDQAALDELSDKLKGHRRIWVVFSHSIKNEDKVAAYLDQSYETTEKKEYFGIKVLTLTRKNTD